MEPGGLSRLFKGTVKLSTKPGLEWGGEQTIMRKLSDRGRKKSPLLPPGTNM